MARLFITVGRKSGKWQVISGPDSDWVGQRQAFWDSVDSGGGGFESLQLWSSSGGCVKRKVFHDNDPAPEPTPTKKKAAKKDS